MSWIAVIGFNLQALRSSANFSAPPADALMCLTMYLVRTGPMNITAIMRNVCMAITNDTSTLVEAAMIATESEPPGLVAR